jgi:hypothetical protein
MAGKRFRKPADDSHQPDSDNLIPVTADVIADRDTELISAGNLFARVGLNDISFCLFLAFVDRLRDGINKHEFIDIDCTFKGNHKICPYLQGKLPSMRLKRLPIITDQAIAVALGLERREFYYVKKRMQIKLRSIYRLLSDKKLRTE